MVNIQIFPLFEKETSLCYVLYLYGPELIYLNGLLLTCVACQSFILLLACSIIFNSTDINI